LRFWLAAQRVFLKTAVMAAGKGLFLYNGGNSPPIYSQNYSTK
jgi:hypothetical protein